MAASSRNVNAHPAHLEQADGAAGGQDDGLDGLAHKAAHRIHVRHLDLQGVVSVTWITSLQLGASKRRPCKTGNGPGWHCSAGAPFLQARRRIAAQRPQHRKCPWLAFMGQLCSPLHAQPPRRSTHPAVICCAAGCSRRRVGLKVPRKLGLLRQGTGKQKG